MRPFKIAALASCLAIFGNVSLAAATSNKCVELFSNHPKDTSAALSAESLWKLLNEKTLHGTEIIQYLSEDPKLKSLFDASAGVWEKYSIREHTLMVFDVFAEQYSLYFAHNQLQAPPDVRLLQTLKFAIALHDIGKPYAIEAGDKNRQHEFTMPILESSLVKFGFSKNESRLARALVGNDIMGDLVKGVIDESTAKSKLTLVAAEAGMSLADFASLQLFFYTIDAASYPSLRRRIFVATTDGLLVLKVQPAL